MTSRWMAGRDERRDRDDDRRDDRREDRQEREERRERPRERSPRRERGRDRSRSPPRRPRSPPRRSRSPPRRSRSPPRRSRSPARRSKSPPPRKARKTGFSGMSSGGSNFSMAAAMAKMPPGGIVTGGIANDPAAKKARELYVGNLPDGVTESSLKQFLNAALAQAGLVNSPGMSIASLRISQGKFSFAEFRTPDEATLGLHLNGIVMGSNVLSVNRPSAYQGPPSGFIKPWPEMLGEKMLTNPHLAQNPIGLMGGGGPVGGAPGGMPGGMPMVSCAIVLKNMVQVSELKDDTEYSEIKEDIEEEMKSFGPVESSQIPRPVSDIVPVYCGNVYVKFVEIRSAAKALEAMDGKTFGGNSVQCGFYPEDKYDAKEWVSI
eukprot:TRINITY_DN17732_c0_g2_i1.p1 TRINITY_DN17732_c0_g2~~TRINITY_DN17732_c0_g2_i1.p1  ORF type:complete len:377 (-),score=65.42 TRINITY_DN17732_c0_g2_i1:464-1594(-)